MMTVVSALLYTLAVLIAILLICLVLVQPSKGGGLGSAFGSIGEGIFGAQTMGHLSKLTVILITAFFAVTLLLAAVSGHKGVKSAASKSAVMEMSAKKTEVPKSVKTPAAKPAAAKAAEKPAKTAEKNVKAAEKPVKTGK